MVSQKEFPYLHADAGSENFNLPPNLFQNSHTVVFPNPLSRSILITFLITATLEVASPSAIVTDFQTNFSRIIGCTPDSFSSATTMQSIAQHPHFYRTDSFQSGKKHTCNFMRLFVPIDVWFLILQNVSETPLAYWSATNWSRAYRFSYMQPFLLHKYPAPATRASLSSTPSPSAPTARTMVYYLLPPFLLPFSLLRHEWCHSSRSSTMDASFNL